LAGNSNILKNSGYAFVLVNRIAALEFSSFKKQKKR
jgi:hypothetical protein